MDHPPDRLGCLFILVASVALWALIAVAARGIVDYLARRGGL